MRKNDRDGIVELISSIEEALNYCYNTEFDSIGTLFEDCEAAISSILNILRNQLSDSARASYALVMDELDSAVQTLKNVGLLPIKEGFYDNTLSSLSILTKKLMEEEVQYEVVFLPYNATMWDSLESIWMAAKDDPRCIPYVIPIPYYDKNRDGSFGQMHYEGDLFPDYVPVTHYQDYDIVNKRPEIIYFHNPYDKYNKVTTVHPMYYSDKLRNYTNMLVYVPYFIVMDNLSEDFAILPGVRFADKVIVQSEQIAEEYKKMYPGKDKDKFLPLGSPKLDKVLRMNQLSREDLNLPKEWKERIGNKKVILYNTHLDNIINRGDMLLKKLQYVFSCFENREDVVLLWRPHPLSESTAAAMNPKILEDYRKLEREYKEKEIGIFDDTPELHRSLALADAYYGDWSSLVPMFGTTGKPVMIQDVEKSGNNCDIKWNDLRFFSCYHQNDELWFAANDFNGLFKFDLKLCKSEFIAEFPFEEKWKEFLYSEVHKYENKLVFVPRSAEHIAVYDMLDRKFRMYKLDSNLVPNIVQHKYMQAIRYNEILLFIPAESKVLIHFNMEKETIDYCPEWYEDLKGHFTYSEDVFFRQGSIILDNYALIPSCVGNVVLKIDMITHEIKVYHIGKSTYRYTDIVFDESYFYLIPRNNTPIVKLCMEDDDLIEVKEYNIFPSEFVSQKYPFSFGKILGNELYIFPMDANMIMRIDLSKDKIIESDKFEDFMYNCFFYSDPWKHCESSEGFFVLSKNNILMLNELGEVQKTWTVELPEEWNEQYVYTHFIQEDKCQENLIEREKRYNSLYGFIELINSISRQEVDKKILMKNDVLINRLDEVIGERVHKYIIKL